MAPIGIKIRSLGRSLEALQILPPARKMDALDKADQEIGAVVGKIADVERALLEPNADTPYLRKK